jgi:hypothetical protein
VKYEKKMKDCIKNLGVLNVLFRARSVAGILIIVLLMSSCKSVQRQVNYQETERFSRVDSVSLTVEKITKVIPVPPARATLDLTIDSIVALPTGAKFSKTDGRATVTVQKTKSGIEATASCDSLNVLVEELRTEVTRLRNEQSDYKSEVDEEITTEGNRLSWWQSLQIAIGRGALIGLLLWLGWWFINSKLKI